MKPDAVLERTCPECGYDLTGLTPPSRCPECGRAFDEHLRVWRPARARSAYGEVLWGLVGFVIVAVAIAPRLKFGADGTVLTTLVVLAIAGGVILWILWRTAQSNRRGRCVAILHDGLFVRNEVLEVTIPWKQVRDVRASHLCNYVRQWNTSETVILPNVFRDDEDAAAFLQAVAEMTAPYTNHED